jgi:hypothetical protein
MHGHGVRGRCGWQQWPREGSVHLFAASCVYCRKEQGRAARHLPTPMQGALGTL